MTEERPGPQKVQPGTVSEEHLKSILESLVFVSDRPVPAQRLARVARSKVAEVRRLLEQLTDDYRGRGVELVELANGYQFRSAAANAPFVREIVQQKPVRLSRAQLETLAICAYRQPLTRPELEEIRGVDSGSAVKVLLERGLMKMLGRKDEPGRPLIYGTTPYFLEFFGLKSLDELPTLKEFTELTDESKILFARRTGENIESIADIEIDEETAEQTGEFMEDSLESGSEEANSEEANSEEANSEEANSEEANSEEANSEEDDSEEDDSEEDHSEEDDSEEDHSEEARAGSADDDDSDDDDSDDDDSDDDDSDDDDSDDDDSDDDDSDDDDSDDDDSDDDDSDDDDSDDDDSDDDDSDDDDSDDDDSDDDDSDDDDSDDDDEEEKA